MIAGYSVALGRDSWDDNGASFIIEERYDTQNNAWWVHSSSGPYVRIGGGNAGMSMAADILVHEFAHGVWRSEGLLNLDTPTQALSESFSDCMTIRFDLINGGDHTVLGEMRTTGSSRNFGNPSSYNNYPDYVTELTGNRHRDSSIPTLAFFLAAFGGNHPDPTHSSINVPGCGPTYATYILYDTLLYQYTDPLSMEEACVDQTLTALNYGYAYCTAFASAWYAVGVDSAFWHGAIGKWALSYIGWVYFDTSGNNFLLPNGKWYAYSNFNAETGQMDIYSYESGIWNRTSAEIFPYFYYWTGSTQHLDYFTGGFL